MKAGVVGAGIMGQLLALSLQNEGWQVTLFDQNSRTSLLSNCSGVAAGLLTPFSELDKADLLIAQLGEEAIQTHWPAILQRLPEPVSFQCLGSLVLHHPRDQAEWITFSQLIRSKIGSRTIYAPLTPAQLTELEPDLERFQAAYYFQNEGQIDCQQLLSTLERHLDEQGVNWQTNTLVSAVQPGKIIFDKQTQRFDMVFDCRGLSAKSIFADLRGLRGELIWLHAPEVTLHRPIRFLHPRYSLYIAPRKGNVYLVGASEIESEDHSPISVRTILELLTAAYYIHAGFAEARLIKTSTHCRPTLLNHLPRIQWEDGLIAVNGLYRHGYLIAPTLAAEIMRGLNNNRQYQTLWEKNCEKN